MPDAEVQHVLVDTAQDSPLVVALTDGQLQELGRAIAADATATANGSRAVVDAVEGIDVTGASALTSQQYDDLMTVNTATNAALVVVVALLVVLCGLVFAQIMTRRWAA